MSRSMDELSRLRAKLERTFQEGGNVEMEEVKELARIGKMAAHLNVFSVRPIANGFIVDYDDVQEYEIQVPIYRPRAPGHPNPARALGAPPEIETQRKWKVVRKEIYCADAEAIKVQVDEALRLSEKVKLMKAQDVLSGVDELGTVAVGI